MTKNEYIKRYALVRDIVNKHDPIGLLPGTGTPDDEYGAEVAKILGLITGPVDEDSLTKGIRDIFRVAFGGSKLGEKLPGVDEAYRAIAKDITTRLSDMHPSP